MEVEQISQSLANFNKEIRLPQSVTPAIFNTIVNVAIDCIESATGKDSPLVTYLRREPPVPMINREDWNGYYGKFCSNPDPSIKKPTEIRPDLVFYPIALIAVIAHEGTHAIDPQLHKATEFAQQFRSISPDHEDYCSKTLTWAAMENQSESTAVRAEIEVLAKIKPPAFLVPAQLEYFNEQRPAGHAARTIQLAHNECRDQAIKLAQVVSGLINKNSSLALSALLPETQNFLNYALYNRNKENNWPSIMIHQLEKIRNLFSQYVGSHSLYETQFYQFKEILHKTKDINDQYSDLAEKFIRPPLKII